MNLLFHSAQLDTILFELSYEDILNYVTYKNKDILLWETEDGYDIYLKKEKTDVSDAENNVDELICHLNINDVSDSSKKEFLNTYSIFYELKLYNVINDIISFILGECPDCGGNVTFLPFLYISNDENKKYSCTCSSCKRTIRPTKTLKEMQNSWYESSSAVS